MQYRRMKQKSWKNGFCFSDAPNQEFRSICNRIIRKQEKEIVKREIEEELDEKDKAA